MDISKKFKDGKRLPGEALQELQAAIDTLSPDTLQELQTQHDRYGVTDLDKALLAIPLNERQIKGIKARTAEERWQETGSFGGSPDHFRQQQDHQEGRDRKIAKINAEAMVEAMAKAGLAPIVDQPAEVDPADWVEVAGLKKHFGTYFYDTHIRKILTHWKNDVYVNVRKRKNPKNQVP